MIQRFCGSIWKHLFCLSLIATGECKASIDDNPFADGNTIRIDSYSSIKRPDLKIRNSGRFRVRRLEDGIMPTAC